MYYFDNEMLSNEGSIRRTALCVNEKRIAIRISTMYPLAPAPHRTVCPYHNYEGNNINDNGLKSGIFIEVDDLWEDASTG